MGHTPEDLPRSDYHRRVAEPLAQASNRSRIGFSADVGVRTVILFLGALAFVETGAFIMRLARIYQQNQLAGLLEARDDGMYRFTYDTAFRGEPVSLTMPTSQQVWEFPRFPAPFEGLLPEGGQLEALLRLRKLDRHDLFGQLLAVGRDVVGSLRIEAAP